MDWTKDKQNKYHKFAKTYIASYGKKIDCADLAIVTLVEFADKEKLPVRFKYYDKGWQWVEFALGDDKKKFKKQAMNMLGALNIIDNTLKVGVASAKAGDFIMSRWSSSQGHTRVIQSIIPEGNKFKVVWYQGNLPPVKPERREEYFANINGVYEQQPRRWNFEQFNK